MRPIQANRGGLIPKPEFRIKKHLGSRKSFHRLALVHDH
jgi:hypothetical protein